MSQRDWSLFPEENPNPVVESDSTGTLTYVNPQARTRFPDLLELQWRHPLLDGIHEIIGGFATGRDDYVRRRVDIGDDVFEQKICYSAEAGRAVLRIYSHDVTALTRAEERMQHLARQIVVAQEEERHRVARELHDEAGQALAALKIGLQLLRDDVAEGSPEVADTIRDAVDLVETTRNQIRVIARDLRPPALDGLGLDMALHSFCRDFARRTKLDITYTSAGPTEVPDAVEMCLYRFLQEALSNVAVHAAARHVTVALRGSADSIVIEVVDDGRGFSGEVPEGGMGIAGMRERVRLLGGTTMVESDAGGGTTVTAVLPRGDQP